MNPAEIIIDADYTDDLAFLENTPSQAESQLDILEQAARGIGLYVNSNKKEFLCFKTRMSHMHFK